ncbi:MAG: hypothetical protein QMC80_07145 [Thermoplasmatales archaeon]|nr:hypothetical protein [Thermoplasmatales archaeon]
MRILENMDLFEVFIPSLILDEVVERLKTLVNYSLIINTCC